MISGIYIHSNVSAIKEGDLDIDLNTLIELIEMRMYNKKII